MDGAGEVGHGGQDVGDKDGRDVYRALGERGSGSLLDGEGGEVVAVDQSAGEAGEQGAGGGMAGVERERRVDDGGAVGGVEYAPGGGGDLGEGHGDHRTGSSVCDRTMPRRA